MKAKLVTIDQANRMLPLLRQIVLDIRASWDQIIAKRSELEFRERDLKQTRSHGTDPRDDSARCHRIEELKSELNSLIERINSYIREVEELGCYVEEFKRGIINFPSLYHGRKVFLCWGVEERQVSSWHELDESYNDRVPIRDVSHFLSDGPKIRG